MARPKAIKLYVDLRYHLVAYHTIERALRDNPDSKKEDYHQFDSKMEYERYLYLRACEQEGDIQDLVAHPDTYEIVPRLSLPKNALRKKARYKQHRVYTPDFRYICNGIIVYEDFKGYKATAGASLQHTLFIKMLMDSGMPAKAFHFKVVKSITAHPSEE